MQPPGQRLVRSGRKGSLRSTTGPATQSDRLGQGGGGQGAASLELLLLIVKIVVVGLCLLFCCCDCSPNYYSCCYRHVYCFVVVFLFFSSYYD